MNLQECEAWADRTPGNTSRERKASAGDTPGTTPQAVSHRRLVARSTYYNVVKRTNGSDFECGGITKTPTACAKDFERARRVSSISEVRTDKRCAVERTASRASQTYLKYGESREGLHGRRVQNLAKTHRKLRTNKNAYEIASGYCRRITMNLQRCKAGK